MTTALNLAQYAATVAKIEKINARAAKRSLGGRLAVEVGEQYKIRVCDHDRETPCEVACFPGQHHYENRVDVEITGEAPKFAGWTFLARVDRVGESFTLAAAPGVEHVSREGIDLGTCSHCATNRVRNTTYVLANESGERVQVGSTCIKDFLGWEGNIAWLDSNISLDEEFFGGSYVAPEYKVADITRLAITSVRMRGFVSAQSYDKQSTREHVSLVFARRLRDDERRERDALLAAAAATTDEDVETLLGFILSDDFAGDSTYVENLKVIAGQEFITDRQFGILVSAPQAYAKHLGLVAERAAKVASEWIGTVGEKITVTVTLERVQAVETQYGTSLLIVGRTEAGEIVKTFTTAGWAWDVEEGQSVTVTATVKNHEDYNGTHQTAVTRAKKVVA